MTDRPNYAPGCFGRPMQYAEDEVCTACPYSAKCAPISQRARDQLRQHFGIAKPTRVRAKDVLPVKAQRHFDELGKSEEQVRSAMQQGRNPYSTREGFMGLVCHMILATGAIKRSMLEDALLKHRGYNTETSSVYTRYSLQILQHCGAISMEGDTVKLLRG